ncbi:hypothetical protein V8F20_001077 [Naviculisporaceae sp. PSN 640]
MDGWKTGGRVIHHVMYGRTVPDRQDKTMPFQDSKVWSLVSSNGVAMIRRKREGPKDMIRPKHECLNVFGLGLVFSVPNCCLPGEEEALKAKVYQEPGPVNPSGLHDCPGRYNAGEIAPIMGLICAPAPSFFSLVFSFSVSFCGFADIGQGRLTGDWGKWRAGGDLNVVAHLSFSSSLVYLHSLILFVGNT